MTNIDKAWEEYRESRGFVHEDRSNNTMYSKIDFISGWIAGRDALLERQNYSKKEEAHVNVIETAHKVLYAKKSSKAEKTKRGSALTQRD